MPAPVLRTTVRMTLPVSPRCRGIVAAFICAALVAWAPSAEAGQRNVVLLKIKAWGARANVCKRAVKSVLRSEHNLMSTSKYMRTRRKLRRFQWVPKNVAAVASAVGADALVHVRILRRYRTWTLVIRVRAGKTGEIAKDLKIPMRRGRCDMRTIKALRDELLGALASVPSIDGEDEDTTEETPVADPEPTPDQTTSDEPSVSKKAAPAKGSTLGAIGGSLDVGFSAIGRTLQFGVDAGIPAAMQPRQYEGGLVGGVHVDAELYPFKHKTSKSFLSRQVSRIGVSFGLDRSVSMKSTLTANGSEQQFATTQSRWTVGGMYRLPLGNGAFKLAAGYNQLGFDVDSGSVATGVPNVGYGFVDAGAALELPLGKRLTVHVDGRYLHVLDAGDIVDAMAYGTATITGAAGRASLDINVTSKLRLRLGVSYLRMAFEFDGSGQMTDLDADSQQDVSTAEDTYAGGFVSAGYRF